MYPNTATQLKESKKMPIKDYLNAASVYQVSHLVFISMTAKASYIKFAKLPEGPTLTFKISGYMLSSDIYEGKANPKSLNKSVYSKPLLVLNGMGNEDDQELKICSLMFQSIFPPINAQKSKIKECKRVVLISSTSKQDNTFEFRHYKINTKHRDINKQIKKVFTMGSKLDLSKYEDISEFALKAGAGYGTDSEAEDFPDSKIELPDDHGDKIKGSKVAVRLEELGPRMTLKLIKIQENLFKGNVLYHRYMKKSKQEIRELMTSAKTKGKKEREQMEKKELRSKRLRKNPEELDESSKMKPIPKKKKVINEFD